MRGRKPTPTVLKLLAGNPGKRELNPDEPQPDALETACPEEITDPVAQKEWARVMIPAITRGQVTSDDRVFAIAHCELWATYRSQLADAMKHAHVISAGKHGYPMPNPARVMAHRTLFILTKIDAELGFSPTSRTRIKVPGGSRVKQSKVQMFLRRKHA